MYDTSAPLFEGHSAIDNILTISKSQRKNPIKYLFRAISLASANYDVIIDSTSTNKSEFISLFARKTSIKIGRKKKGRGFAYSHKIPKHLLQGNKIDQRLAMLKPLESLGYDFTEIRGMEMRITPSERLAMREALIKRGVDLSKRMVGFCVSARLSQKKWCRAEMEKVIKHCVAKYDIQVILLAGLPHEQKDARVVFESMGKPSNVFHGVEVNSLRDLASLISYCDVFIGNEGGPRHIAEALGLPTATVFAPCSRIGEWMPTNSSKHQGIEWQSIRASEGLPYGFDEIGDANYYKLYNRIKSEHFIPIVDSVISLSQAIEN